MNVIYKNTPINVRFYGNEGEPVVLLHGFLESSKIWDDLIPELETRNRLVVPDLFGHGMTPKHSDIHTMEEMAEAVLQIIDVSELRPAKFIGHSMGGYVSLAFLEKYPECVSGILLLNSSPFSDSDERLVERDQVIKVVQKHKDIMIKSGVKRLFAEENLPTYQERVKSLIEEALKMQVDSVIASTKGMRQRKDRTDVLKNYKGKKWIFAGEKDALIPLDSSEKAAQKTAAKLFKFSGGHMSYIENRDKVLKKIQAFLKEDEA